MVLGRTRPAASKKKVLVSVRAARREANVWNGMWKEKGKEKEKKGDGRKYFYHAYTLTATSSPSSQLPKTSLHAAIASAFAPARLAQAIAQLMAHVPSSVVTV